MLYISLPSCSTAHTASGWINNLFFPIRHAACFYLCLRPPVVLLLLLVRDTCYINRTEDRIAPFCSFWNVSCNRPLFFPSITQSLSPFPSPPRDT